MTVISLGECLLTQSNCMRPKRANVCLPTKIEGTSQASKTKEHLTNTHKAKLHTRKRHTTKKGQVKSAQNKSMSTLTFIGF